MGWEVQGGFHVLPHLGKAQAPQEQSKSLKLWL